VSLETTIVCSSAFFVTDKDLIQFHVADKVIEVFEANHIPYETYSDVKANPTIANVQNGVAAFKNSGADFIVALGGGSSIDTAKGIGIVVNNPMFVRWKVWLLQKRKRYLRLLFLQQLVPLLKSPLIM